LARFTTPVFHARITHIGLPNGCDITQALSDFDSRCIGLLNLNENMIALAAGGESEFFIDTKVAEFLFDNGAALRLAKRVRKRVEWQEVVGRARLTHSQASSKTTAWQAIPSPRPIAPSCSVVVALTLTRSRGALSAAAILEHIASLCGASLGNCATTVISALDREKPRAPTSEHTCSNKKTLDTPAY
jgi:hypothetical protein